MKTTDIFNLGIGGVNLLLHRFKWFCITKIELCYLSLIGIRMGGSKTEFKGWARFFRRTGSTIIIGNNCRLNYCSLSNHIGLNHRCIISTMEPDAKLTIGDNLGMSSSTITCFKRIDIGNNVRIGANCVIADGDFHMDDPRVGPAKPVRICDGVWLGYGVIVMKGVTIGENSVIGMNSVVTNDIPENSVAVGSPAKVIRKLDEDVIQKLENK